MGASSPKEKIFKSVTTVMSYINKRMQTSENEANRLIKLANKHIKNGQYEGDLMY